MISDDTLHAVAAILRVEADDLTDSAHRVVLFAGRKAAQPKLIRAGLLRGYAKELLAEAATRGVAACETCERTGNASPLDFP